MSDKPAPFNLVREFAELKRRRDALVAAIEEMQGRVSDTECTKCAELTVKKKAAEEARDQSTVTDCVGLLRRHPRHGKLPVSGPLDDHWAWW
ncbi:hypothetical protein ACWC0A_32560 [Streptomyces scopuliridis]